MHTGKRNDTSILTNACSTNHIELAVGCIVRDKNRRQYRVAEITNGQVVIYPIDGFGRLIGSLSTAKRELEIIRDADGYDRDGFDRDGYDRDGYDYKGYDREGRNSLGIDQYGFDRNGYDKDGYDKSGFDKNGLNREGKRRGEGTALPNYQGSKYAGASTSWPGAQKSKKKK